MSNSYAEKISLKCPKTNQTFNFDLWLIIDCDERPDLITKAREGTLHIAFSPYTGHEVMSIDAPLLVFQPTRQPPMFFIPAKQLTEVENTHLVQVFVQQLRETIGASWQNTWIENGVFPLSVYDMYQAVINLNQPQKNYKDQQVAIRYSNALQDIFRQLNEPIDVIQNTPHRVQLCKQALNLLSKEGEEEVWAMLQSELGFNLFRTPLGDRAENIERAIEAYSQALTVRTHDNMPTEWASDMTLLAAAYEERIRGDRAENIENAIEAYNQALTVRTHDNKPAEWAFMKHRLGRAYEERIRGDRAENIENAIEAYNQALTVRTHDNKPAEWASDMTLLAAAYGRRIRGDRAENIENAIKVYNQALTVRTRLDMPAEWAITMNLLANAYQTRIRGDRSQNIKYAIEIYKEVLTVRTRDAMPLEWAETMTNLAIAYQNRANGDIAQNIEDAIAVYKEVLTVRTPDVIPLGWAQTMLNLANVYQARIHGNRAENIENSIAAYEKVLTIITNKNMPIDWASTMNNLACAYTHRIYGSYSKNIEESISIYQQALSVRRKDFMPIEWAETIANLAGAYTDRIEGDRAQNLEEALNAYQEALTVLNKKNTPLQWATAKVSLAKMYFLRIEGDQAQNLEEALNAYQEALTILNKNNMLFEWATAICGLGMVYLKRMEGDKAQNLEETIATSEQVLAIVTQKSIPSIWATAVNNLASAYEARIEGDKEQNIENAISMYQKVLTVRTRTASPIEWARTMNALALVYYKRLRGNKSQNLNKSIAICQETLAVITRNDFPDERLRILKDLASFYADEKRWLETYQTILDAIAVGGDIFIAAYSDSGRIDIIKQTGILFIHAAYTALHLNKYDEALIHLESGKARLLNEAQSLGDSNLIRLESTEREHVQELRERIKLLDYESRLMADHPARRNNRTISNDQQEARNALRALIDQLRTKYRNFMPEGLPLDQLLSVIPQGGALVMPLFTSDGSAVFIIPAGVNKITEQHIILLDEFTIHDLNTLIRGTTSKPGWLHYYVNYINTSRNELTSFEEKAKAHVQFLNGINDVTHRLWEQLIGQVHECLQHFGVMQVLLIPQGNLNLLPLHVAWHEVENIRKYFFDYYVINFSPSLTVLASHESDHFTIEHKALVAGVGQYVSMNPLPNTHTEVKSIAELFGTMPLLDEAASVSAIKANVVGKTHIHLSCHGGFGWGENIYASCLYLAHEEALPIFEIMAKFDMSAARLVVLSACETGIIDFDNLPNESIGLPTGFMYAGASAVISSLWTVDDGSTALLMEKMYILMLDPAKPLPPLEALRAAQFWLRNATVQDLAAYYKSYLIPRMSAPEALKAYIEIFQQGPLDLKPYEHPFYWAAFTYNGI